jgi:hypothetical protein
LDHTSRYTGLLAFHRELLFVPNGCELVEIWLARIWVVETVEEVCEALGANGHVAKSCLDVYFSFKSYSKNDPKNPYPTPS